MLCNSRFREFDVAFDRCWGGICGAVCLGAAVMSTGVLRMIVSFLIAMTLARAHEAPSGWAYPKDCCGGDCHPVPCEEVSAVAPRDGFVGPDYEWHGLTFRKPQHQFSPDGACHVCVGNFKPLLPRCIFTPIPAGT
jgi:hypothetical protein